MRHAFASLLLRGGVPITHVAAQLGHRDPSITLRVYSHWLPTRQPNASSTACTPLREATASAASDYSSVQREAKLVLDRDPVYRPLTVSS